MVQGGESLYGDFQALHGVSLAVGQVLALIGANGAGKSTLLTSVCGLVLPGRGKVQWQGQHITLLPGRARIAMGIALVPEGRRLFKSLSVEENLVLGGQVGRRGPWDLRSVYDLFPVRREKRGQGATALSGGQQQRHAQHRAGDERRSGRTGRFAGFGCCGAVPVSGRGAGHAGRTAGSRWPDGPWPRRHVRRPFRDLRWRR